MGGVEVLGFKTPPLKFRASRVSNGFFLDPDVRLLAW